MAFASNIQAMNAARKMLKAKGLAASTLKEYFFIEKCDQQWHALLIKPFPEARDPLSCLVSEREGGFNFLKASEAAFRAAIATSAQSRSAEANLSAMPIDDDGYVADSEPSAQDEAEEEEAHANRQKAADALADSLQSAAALPNGKEPWIRVSSVEKPTKFVWHVADRMVAAALAAGKAAPSRKEVQDECVRLGVAHGTARTQYQAWKKACDETALNALRAAELSAKLNSKR